MKNGEEEEEEEEEGGDHDEDWVDGFLADEAADTEEVGEVEDSEPGDLLGKVLALVTQVISLSIIHQN